MKKKYIIIILTILIMVLGIILLINKEGKIKITSDEKKFKQEYESLNNKKTNNKKILEIEIPTENKIEYTPVKKIITKLKEGTSVIYFGFPECPWCRNLVPVLTKIARDYETTIYYYNALKIRDKKSLNENGEIVTEQKGTKEYYQIIDLLKEHLGEYEGLNDETVKRLYFPTVVFIKEGKVIGVHIGTVSSQKDPYKKMTKKQKKELTKILEGYFDELTTGVCEKDAKC